MKIEFNPDEVTDKKWTASTDDEMYDGCGTTPLEAVCDLATGLERRITPKED